MKTKLMYSRGDGCYLAGIRPEMVVDYEIAKDLLDALKRTLKIVETIPDLTSDEIQIMKLAQQTIYKYL